MQLIQEHSTQHTPESLVHSLRGLPGLVLLRSGLFDAIQARYSFVTARPFLTFRAYGARCEARTGQGRLLVHFGNPWQQLNSLLARYELLRELDLPFPAGGCFGFWGYDLKNFVEPKLPQRAINDLDLPDCHLGFYDSLVIFDHRCGKTWIVATGLDLDGSRSTALARAQRSFWQERLDLAATSPAQHLEHGGVSSVVGSNLSRSEFIARIVAAQRYIRIGHIYQVNLAQRFAVEGLGGLELYERLASVSPSPFAAYLDCGEFQIVSSSPELFLRLSGQHVQTRPIKGTRARSPDPTRDAQLTYELQTSPKEMAELVMITDLLRNDLGKICQFGSVHVPELVRLERYAHVQHLVSTVEGQLRPELTHLEALAACFPGGSITGAPKFRAMEIIDELEPVRRGPYTGALGYLGFNRESQLSIIIRAAVCVDTLARFHAGAGIVADSDPEAEYAETVSKAQGFFEALGCSVEARNPIQGGMTGARHSSEAANSPNQP
jgi:para-aminobenzoate synthetase component I